MNASLPDLSRLTLEQREAMRAAVLDEARVRRARRDLAACIEYHGETVYRWQRAVADVLSSLSESVRQGEARNVLFEAPPRHGKTRIVGERWVPHHLVTNPGHRAILASAELSLTRRTSSRAQRYADLLMRSPVGRAASQGATWTADEWHIGEDGVCLARGVGGNIMGAGYHIGLVDDPFKSREMAQSEREQERVWEWFSETFASRAQEGAATVLFHQRWSDGDLAGRWREHCRANAIPLETYTFRALAEEDDPLGREIGEPLCPELVSAETLERRRKLIGGTGFAALYQQRPAPAEGGLFKLTWLEGVYTLPPREQARACERVWLSCDPNRKRTKAGSLAVVHVYGQIGAKRMLLHRWAERCDFPELRAAIRTIARDWRCMPVLIEGAASGDALISDLRGEVDGITPVQPMPSPDRKFTEAQAVSGILEAGQLLLPLPEYAPWVDEFRANVAAFPFGATNDDVDTMTQALQWSRGQALDVAAMYEILANDPW